MWITRLILRYEKAFRIYSSCGAVITAQCRHFARDIELGDMGWATDSAIIQGGTDPQGQHTHTHLPTHTHTHTDTPSCSSR